MHKWTFRIWFVVAILSLVLFCLYAAAGDATDAASCAGLMALAIGGTVICIGERWRR